MADDTPRPSTRRESASVGEVVEYVKTYAKQETIGPLRNVGKFVGFGIAGAVPLAIGLFLLLLGLLRLLQTETGWDTSRYWSWVPYVIVFVVALGLLGATVWRINKTYLWKEDRT
jgi:predicted cobalt transporter CbtA